MFLHDIKRNLTGTALKLAISAICIASFAFPCRNAQAQALDGKTIRIVVPAAIGSFPDLLARIAANQLKNSLAVTTVIENRIGDGELAAARQVKSATNDGLTLLLGQGSALAIATLTNASPGIDFDADFEVVAVVADVPLVIVTSSASGPKSLKEAIDEASITSKKVVLGNPAWLSIPHVFGEQLDQVSGSKFQHVSLGNNPQGTQRVVSGEVPVYVDTVFPVQQLLKEGKLRALAITSAKELPGYEGIPLTRDLYPDLTGSAVYALLAPKGTPPEIVNRINLALSATAQNANAAVKRTFGNYLTGGTTAEAKAILAKQKATWSEVIKKAGLKPE